MADPEPFSCWKKGWLISSGNVSQAAAAKKGAGDIPGKMQQNGLQTKHSSQARMVYFFFLTYI